MKDTLTQIGLVILGVFIVVTLILGNGNSMKTNMNDGVTTKLDGEVNKVMTNTTNP